MNEDLIIEVWDVFKEYVPEKSRDLVANQYVEFLLGKDVEPSVLEGLRGYDDHLDEAIDLALGSSESDGEEEDESDWDETDDDEDY